MEAVAAVASIVGIVGAGTKLTLVMLDVAGKLGSAADELRAAGVEISLFCAVLNQLQRTLEKMQRKRYSVSAIETTDQILSHCKTIFNELNQQMIYINGLKDWEARLKWILGWKHQLRVQRTTLESCKITLHIMLTTLSFAKKVNSRRESMLEPDRGEDADDLMITNALNAARQDSIRRLEALEDSENLPTELDAQGGTETINSAERAMENSKAWDE